MTHAAIIRGHYAMAERASSVGLTESGKAAITGQVPPYRGTQAVWDTLRAYESVHAAFRDGEKIEIQPPGYDGVVKEGFEAGIVMGALDKCLTSAREIVRVVGCLIPDDFPFLEPIVGVSVLLCIANLY